MHTEEEVAAALPEPEDGTVLVVDDGDGEWKVIWRDDRTAKHWYDGDSRGQNWWADADEDPMGLYQHVQYAEAVHVLGQPVAVFRS